MTRLPYAAQALIAQVEAERGEVKVREGEPDGFDVVRSISFDKPTSKWLRPRISHSGMDERLTSAVEERGILTLTFQSTSVLADRDDDFNLEIPPAGDEPEGQPIMEQEIGGEVPAP